MWKLQSALKWRKNGSESDGTRDDRSDFALPHKRVEGFMGHPNVQ
jgi:hypothetical protein